MRFPSECYQMEQVIAQYLPELRPSQRRGLALWVYGTILAHSSTQRASALSSIMGPSMGCANASGSGFTMVTMVLIRLVHVMCNWK